MVYDSRRRLTVLFVLLVSAALAIPCAGQAVGRSPIDNFAKLFPSPTGQNGYEDFVKAGDVLLNAPTWAEYEKALESEQPPTLEMKRRVIADGQTRIVLDAIRAGLMKPVRSPRATIDDETLLPELSSFRSLARLLGVEIYVRLADGRVSLALDSLATALKFGYVVQTDSLISGLVAISVDAIAIRQLAEHLDQLSIRDCEKLSELARTWLDLPDPAIQILTIDKKSTVGVLRKYRSDPAKLLKELDPKNSVPDRQQRFQKLEEMVTKNPDGFGPIFDQAAVLVSGNYDEALASLNQPAWERKSPVVDASTPAGLVADLLAGGVLGRVIERYAREQTQVQLLGVHAAIRRFIWEYNQLPGSLDILKLGRMAIDPFSGKPFEFKRTEGMHYTLRSIGPLEQSPQPGTPPNQRAPISVGPN